MKTWVLLGSMILLLALVCAFVAVGTWHMGSEESAFLEAIQEQKVIDAGKNWCRENVRKILKWYNKLSKNTEKCQQQKTVGIGVLDSSSYGVHVVKEALAELTRGNTWKNHFEVLSLTQINKTIVEVAQELTELYNIQVFIGPEEGSDLEELLVWARSRPHPRNLIVFVTPAVITDNSYVERREDDSHAVIQVRMPPSSNLQATLHQMYKQNISEVLMLTTSEHPPFLTNFWQNLTNGHQITEMIVQKSSSASKIVTQLEKGIQEYHQSNLESEIGLLLTENFILDQLLSESSVNSLIFNIPWFMSVEETYDNSVLPRVFPKNQDLDLSLVLRLHSAVKNYKWLKNINETVQEEVGGSITLNANLVEHTYDSVVIAAHIGSWLVDKALDLDALSKRVSQDSSMWVGISGFLEFGETFQRDYGQYLVLKLGRNISGQVTQYPLDLWQIVGHRF